MAASTRPGWRCSPRGEGQPDLREALPAVSPPYASTFTPPVAGGCSGNGLLSAYAARLRRRRTDGEGRGDHGGARGLCRSSASTAWEGWPAYCDCSAPGRRAASTWPPSRPRRVSGCVRHRSCPSRPGCGLGVFDGGGTCWRLPVSGKPAKWTVVLLDVPTTWDDSGRRTAPRRFPTDG